jgi:glycosyltransferase involved in cell wall biosynthesis
MHTLYLCYFGLREPLVQTQVLPYLRQLRQDGITVSLLTFEPGWPESWSETERREWEEILGRDGIRWLARRYHKRPTLPATLYDICVGVWTTARLGACERLDVLHARSYVAALMGRLARPFTRSRLIFDIRGLMADEYVDAGSWPAQGLLYRLTKAAERWLVRSADGFVVLTHKARELLFPSANGASENETGESEVEGRPVAVIPCCVDLKQFRMANAAGREAVRHRLGAEGRRVVVYVGSLGGWYLTGATLDLLEQARRQDPATFALILTQRETEQAVSQLRARGFTSADFHVTSAAPSEVPDYLAAADIALSLIKPCYSKQASSPTKIAEYLACGVPVISTAGIGDLDELFAREQVGVILDRLATADYDSALREADRLRATPELRSRCRQVAAAHFDLESVGGARYRRLYQRLSPSSRVAEPRPAWAPEK